MLSNLVKFQIAHLYETQNKHKAAKDGYEFLLNEKNISLELKADVYRQLGEFLINLKPSGW